MNLKEKDVKTWTECNWLMIGSMAGWREYGNEPSDHIKDRVFLDYLSDY